jgi:S-adenosylmethionine:tRNA ribosyltransferase-isomerase
VELLIERVLHRPRGGGHMKVSKKPPVGTVLPWPAASRATLLGRWPDADGALFRFALSADPYTLMEQHGHVPLPPYITHADSADDVRRYQTVFARHPGAVAAPTAALHFDEALLAALDARGVQRASVTLHVGAGTFQPVKTETHRRAPHAQRALSTCRGHTGRPLPPAGPAAAGWWRWAPPPCARWSRGPRTGETGGRHRHLHHAGLSSSRWWTG